MGDLSFVPMTITACITVMAIIVLWERRRKIRWQTNIGYFEEDGVSTKNQDPVTSNNQDDANSLSSTIPNGEIDDLFVVETFGAGKEISEEDKEHSLVITLEEQDYLEKLAGRDITVKSKKDALKTFFQNPKVKMALLITMAIILFAGLIIFSIIAGQNQWFG